MSPGLQFRALGVPPHSWGGLCEPGSPALSDSSRAEPREVEGFMAGRQPARPAAYHPAMGTKFSYTNDGDGQRRRAGHYGDWF